ncbi:peptidoglycan-recognition protein LF-like isoform X2 [Macrosteles quadrilineatus]|nr:peptidoglycan-recognition protein LF-like isoform X2 [Macrosteles quadrilineatus]
MVFFLTTREEWGALSPLEPPIPLKLPVRDIVLTYVRNWSGYIEDDHIDYTGQVQALQRRQIEEKKLSDIKYNFLVTPQGQTYECRGWHGAVPAPKHRPEWSNNVLVIAQLNWRVADGYFRPMIQAIYELVRFGVMVGYIKKRHQFLETKPWRCPKVIPKLQ